MQHKLDGSVQPNILMTFVLIRTLVTVVVMQQLVGVNCAEQFTDFQLSLSHDHITVVKDNTIGTFSRVAVVARTRNALPGSCVLSTR